MSMMAMWIIRRVCVELESMSICSRTTNDQRVADSGLLSLWNGIEWNGKEHLYSAKPVRALSAYNFILYFVLASRNKPISLNLAAS